MVPCPALASIPRQQLPGFLSSAGLLQSSMPGALLFWPARGNPAAQAHVAQRHLAILAELPLPDSCFAGALWHFSCLWAEASGPFWLTCSEGYGQQLAGSARQFALAGCSDSAEAGSPFTGFTSLLVSASACIRLVHEWEARCSRRTLTFYHFHILVYPLGMRLYQAPTSWQSV